MAQAPCKRTCPLAVHGHLHLKRVFHPSPARTRTLPPDRPARFIFAPIQIDLQWMHPRSGIAYEPLITAGLLIHGLRFDFESSVLTKKPIARRNRAGMARHQHFAAPSDRRISERVSVVVHPADIISAIDWIVDSAETFFLYRQKKVARVLPVMQSGQIGRASCRERV